ncbi:Mucin-like protein [Giardia duodenalis ATCC 50581]|uniref:Mucin-like protein n=1 Tax=Giardia intestinalis (strain ATCC 50581 / GS clone H7) TaxID=598745 RepID=C6LSA2_GIAIB|nr:Mucin-like protein [Giardia intestinalis ATCC 50581]
MHSYNQAAPTSSSRPLTHESSFLIKTSPRGEPKQAAQDQYSSIVQENADTHHQLLSSVAPSAAAHSSIQSKSFFADESNDDVPVTQMILTFTADSHLVENPHYQDLSADQSTNSTANLQNEPLDKPLQEPTTIVDSLMDISEPTTMPSTTQPSRLNSAQSIVIPEVTMTFAVNRELGMVPSDSSKGSYPQTTSPARVITLSRSAIERVPKPSNSLDEPDHENQLDEFETCDLLAEQPEETYEENHSPSDSLVMHSSRESDTPSCEHTHPESTPKDVMSHQHGSSIPNSSNELAKQTTANASIVDEARQATSPSVPPTKEYRATIIRKPKPTIWSKEPSISRHSLPSTPYIMNDYTAAHTFVETVPFAANASILGATTSTSVNMAFPDLPPPQFSNYNHAPEATLSILEEMNIPNGHTSSRALPAVSISRFYSTIPQHSNEYLLSRAFTPVDVIGEDVNGLVQHINTIPTTLENSIVKALPSVRVSHARHSSLELEGFPHTLTEPYKFSQPSPHPSHTPRTTTDTATSALPTHRSVLLAEESHLQLEDLETTIPVSLDGELGPSNYAYQLHSSAPVLPLRSTSVTKSIIEEMYTDQGTHTIAPAPLETSIIDELYSTTNLSTTGNFEQPVSTLNHTSLSEAVPPRPKDELISDFLAEQSIVQIIPGNIENSKPEQQDLLSAALYETTTNIDVILTPNSPVVVSTIDLPLPTFTEPALSSLTVLPPVETMPTRRLHSTKATPTPDAYLEKTPAPDEVSHNTSSYLPTEVSKTDPSDLYVTQDLLIDTTITQSQNAALTRGSIPLATSESCTQATEYLTVPSSSSAAPPTQSHRTRSPSRSLEPASLIKQFSKEPSSSSKRSMRSEEPDVQVQELNMSWTKNSEQHKPATIIQEHSHSPAKIHHAQLPPRARSLERKKPLSEGTSETSYKHVMTPSVESSTTHEQAAPQTNPQVALNDPLPQDLTIGPISSYHTDYSTHRASIPTETESKLDAGLFSEAQQSTYSDHPSRFRDPEQISVHTVPDDIFSVQTGEHSAIHASAAQTSVSIARMASEQEPSSSRHHLTESASSTSKSRQWNAQLASSVVRRDKQLSGASHHVSTSDPQLSYTTAKEASHNDGSNPGTSRIASSVLQNITHLPSESDAITVSINRNRAGPRQVKKQSVHVKDKTVPYHEDGEIECAEVLHPQPQSEATDLPITGRRQRR